MNAASVEPQVGWSRQRWWASILAILAVQILLIFWLAGRRNTLPRSLIPTVSAPQVCLPADSLANWPDLSNPALFVLANRHGFSGPAWMKVPALAYQLPEWSEPTLPLLSPSAQQLDSTLNNFLRTDLAATYELAVRPEPEMPASVPVDNLANTQSIVTIEGELARHPLLTPLKLDAWPATEILASSQVQVGVDQAGSVFSAVLLAKSGSKPADDSALTLARSAHFQPWLWTGPGQPTNAQNRLNWGRLVFHWRTIAPPATNAPAANP